MKERLQKILARANFGSRRASEELIEQKRVRVNGVVAQLGDKADPAVDTIEVDGRKISFKEQRKIYVALNKPINVLTTNLANHKDRRQTVRELIAMEGHLFSIGRLDAESEGLIVMTNDGELVQRLTHPKYKHTKTYRVTVYGLPSLESLERWRNGIYLQDEDGTTYKTAPCAVEIIKGDREVTILRVVMTEGRKRQIRRVAASLGHPVQRLTRTHIGKLELGSLRPGEWRELTGQEVNAMSTSADELKIILERKYEQNKLRRRDDDDPSARSESSSRPFRAPGRGGDRPLIGGSKLRRPRAAGEADDRPRRAPRARSEDEEDRPRRSARPTSGERENPRGDSDRPRRPRAENDDRSARPRRSRSSDEASGDRPRRSQARRSSDDEQRAQRSGRDRPRRPRADEGDDRPRHSRSSGDDEASGERPRRSQARRSSGDDQRAPRSGSDRPRRPRAEDDDRSERPRRPRSTGESSGSSEDRPKRPRTNRPASGGQSKPRRPRKDDDDRGERPSRPSKGGSKPRTPRPKKPRSG